MRTVRTTLREELDFPRDPDGGSRSRFDDEPVCTDVTEKEVEVLQESVLVRVLDIDLASDGDAVTVSCCENDSENDKVLLKDSEDVGSACNDWVPVGSSESDCVKSSDQVTLTAAELLSESLHESVGAILASDVSV